MQFNEQNIISSLIALFISMNWDFHDEFHKTMQLIRILEPTIMTVAVLTFCHSPFRLLSAIAYTFKPSQLKHYIYLANAILSLSLSLDAVVLSASSSSSLSS